MARIAVINESGEVYNLATEKIAEKMRQEGPTQAKKIAYPKKEDGNESSSS